MQKYFIKVSNHKFLQHLRCKLSKNLNKNVHEMTTRDQIMSFDDSGSFIADNFFAKILSMTLRKSKQNEQHAPPNNLLLTLQSQQDGRDDDE